MSAVEHPPIFDPVVSPILPGTTLIEASAGTGKTYCLSHLVLRLLLDDATLAPDQVLVVTFTNAAADELAARIRAVLADALKVARNPAATVGDHVRALVERAAQHADPIPRLEQLALSSDRLAVSTIHGFCKRTLERSAFSSGTPLGLELATDTSDLVQEAVRDVWRKRLHGDALLATLAVARGWTVAADSAQFAAFHRHAGTRFIPAGLELERERAALVAALAAVRGAATPQAAQHLRALIDSKKLSGAKTKPFIVGGGPEAHVAALARASADAATFTAVAALARTALDDAWLKGASDADRVVPLADACQAVLAAVVRVELAWTVALFAELDERVNDAMRQAGVLSQDHLLSRVADALAHPDLGPTLAVELRGQYRAALIDEFQDTDPVQWAIFRTVFTPPTRLVLIGDPKQAIYGFRGADLATYIDAARHVDATWRLGTSFRSSSALVTAVNTVFSGVAPFIDDIAYHPVAAAGKADAKPFVDPAPGLAALHWWVPEDAISSKDATTYAINAWVADEIVRLLAQATLDGTPLKPGNIAVLVRKNDEAATLRDDLRAAGVPAVIAEQGDLLDSPAMTALRRLCAAVLTPHDGRALRRVLAGPLVGWDAARLAAVDADGAQWDRVVLHAADLRRRLLDHGPASLMQHLLAQPWPGDACAPALRLAGLPDGERWLTDLRHAADWLAAQALERHLDGHALLRWLEDAVVARREHDDDERRLRLETDAAAVQIVTMHKAKGLEYDVVFCPYLWTSRAVKTPFTARDQDGFVFVADDAVAGPYQAAAERARLAEDVRLAYVALTRAKHRCYVLWGKFGQGGKEPFGSALGWLLRPASVTEAEVEALREAWIQAEQRDGLGMALSDRLTAWTATGAMSVFTPPSLNQERRRWDMPEAVTPVAQPLPPHVAASVRPWLLTSFTGLTSVRSGEAQHPAGGVHDTNAGDETTTRQLLAERMAAADLLPSLPPGAAAGIALHSLIEHGDFHALPTGEAITKALRVAGCRVTDQAQAEREVRTMLERLATVPVPAVELPGQGATTPWRLADTDASKRHVEWEFLLPLDHLDLGRVGAVFRAAGGVLAESAEALAHLPPRTVRGFLRGFADLVLEHDQRWWVLDWKTNRLSAYGPRDLRTAMVGHHYVLQYHLYVLGLHRFLAARVADYDYDRHIGGAAYVFLRGLDDGQGWFVDRPPLAIITALAACLVPPVFAPAGSATPE